VERNTSSRREPSVKLEGERFPRPSPPTPLPQGERGVGLEECDRMREELRSAARDLRRRIVNSEKWKQAVADGLVPEHLLEAAQALEAG
jgi:hypothetical protein